jgi:hypothetical protein
MNLKRFNAGQDMRLAHPTIAIAAATFAATLALAPALANVDVRQYLDLGQFLTAPGKAPVAAPTKQMPNCRSALGVIVDALGDKDCD